MLPRTIDPPPRAMSLAISSRSYFIRAFTAARVLSPLSSAIAGGLIMRAKRGTARVVFICRILVASTGA